MRSAAAAAGLLVVAIAAACGGGNAASSNPAGVEAIAAPLPPALGARPTVELNRAACAAAGACAVAGQVFTRVAFRALGVLLVQTGGTWRVVTVPMPRGLPPGTKPIADIGSVSCPATGRCIGVGGAHAGDNADAVFMTQQGARWTETALKLPPGAKQGGLSAISCSTVGNCSVVGGVADARFGHQQVLFLDERNGRWGAWREAPLPPENLQVSPFGGELISCQAPGDCTAAGSYENGDYQNVGLLLTERNGTWGRFVQPALPPNENVGSNPLIGLSSLSCPSTGNCTIVGGYFDNERNESGLILNERNGKWHQGIEAPLPSDAGPNPQHGDGPEMPLTAVSCAAARDCAAVGFYRDKRDNMRTLLLSEKAGEWTPSEPKLPADAAGGANPGGLGSVACTAPGRCVAAGGYVTGTTRDGTYSGKPLLVYERQGTWQPGIAVALPADSAATGGASLTSVTCPPAGSCLAIGSYTDKAGDQQGLLVTLPRP